MCILCMLSTAARFSGKSECGVHKTLCVNGVREMFVFSQRDIGLFQIEKWHYEIMNI